MMRKVTNPHLYEPTYKRINHPRFAGGKYYQPVVATLATRRNFWRASEALEYAKRVHKRWCRLYDAWVAMGVKEPTG